MMSFMHAAIPILLACASTLAAQQVDMELLTYPEVQQAILHGKNTVLIYNGGTEQRGPHAVLGGHTLIARRVGLEVARRLGNALLAPVMPFSPAGSHVNPKWPGSVNLPVETFVAVNEAAVASMVVAGFRNIVVMGDHGGGQQELAAMATRLDARYGPKGTHVVFCGAIYRSYADFDEWLKQNHLPVGRHASIPDTSLLMYLAGDQYVRKDKLTVGSKDNGIDGDPRKSTAEIGKILFDKKVTAAVEEIRRLLSR